MAIPFVESLMRKRSRVVQAFIKVLEVMLLSTGLISTLLMLKGALFMPFPCALVFSSLLGFWNSVKCFLSSPLYICITIYFMVLLIKFSSTFYNRVRLVPNNRHHVANIQTRVPPPSPPPPSTSPPSPPSTSPPSPPPSTSPPSPSPSSSPPPPRMAAASPEDISTKIVTIKGLHETSRVNYPNILHETSRVNYPNILHETSRVNYPNILLETSHVNYPNNLHETSHVNYGVEKPNEELIIPQANEIKKTISQLNPKPNLQEPLNVKMETKTYPSKRGKALTVEVPNEEGGDSMEETWKAIMGEGKQRPKKRPLKKSETWDVPTKPRTMPIKRLDSELVVPSSPKWREMRKAESFNDAMSITRRGGLIRRDSSMSLEDFNNKVEGFIKKLKWKAKASAR